MAETSITYSLKYQTRVLCSQTADTINSKWIVGTNALREENEVRVLQYDPDQERLLCTRTHTHASEVWDIAPCPTSEDLLITVWNKAGVYGATLWRASSDSPDLQLQAELAGHTGIVRSALWHTQQSSLVVTVEEAGIKTWDVSDQGAQNTGTASAGEMAQLWCGALHPRSPDLLCTAGGNDLQVWDLRTLAKPSGEVVQAHKMPVRSVSWAPHQEHRVVTAGDDCKLKFWDLRMVGKGASLLDLGGHSHWVWRALYNPFYDQLVASCSSDSLVNLYYTPQLASAAPGQAEGADVAGKSGASPTHVTRSGDLDGKAHTFDEHEDSVYGLAWSGTDPWLFASLSYDGRVVVNKVPKNIKYKILI